MSKLMKSFRLTDSAIHFLTFLSNVTQRSQSEVISDLLYSVVYCDSLSDKLSSEQRMNLLFDDLVLKGYIRR